MTVQSKIFQVTCSCSITTSKYMHSLNVHWSNGKLNMHLFIVECLRVGCREIADQWQTQ